MKTSEKSNVLISKGRVFTCSVAPWETIIQSSIAHYVKLLASKAACA